MAKIIKLEFKNQNLTVNQTGAGIMEYYLADESGRRDIIYGYSEPGENPAFLGCVLFPFPGRVEDSQYQFEGRDYRLSGTFSIDGNSIHGFVFGVDWQIEKCEKSEVILSYDLKKEEYAGKGYPFSVKITIRYFLDENGLNCQTKIENLGETAAPFGLGFHPYFAAADKVDDMNVRISAGKLVEFDSNLKPTRKLLDIASTDLDFNQSKKIGSKIIDNCYTDLVYINGICQTELSDGKNRKITVWQDENFPYLQVYSADTIGDKHRRRGFAVEPQTCSGFTFNQPEMGLKVLKPGEIFEGNWGVTPQISNI